MAEPDDPRVIDLTTGDTARVRVERDGDPFARLTQTERKRLLVRVLCELVAYGESLTHVDLATTTALPAGEALAS